MSPIFRQPYRSLCTVSKQTIGSPETCINVEISDLTDPIALTLDSIPETIEYRDATMPPPISTWRSGVSDLEFLRFPPDYSPPGYGLVVGATPSEFASNG